MEQINRKRLVLALLALVAFVGLTYYVNILVQKRMHPRAYSEHVEKYCSEYSVPEYVAYSVIKVESDFEADAVSDKGACGLMQLMPETYSWLADELGEEVGDIFNEEINVKYGIYYLSILYKRYGDWTVALCAYNAGMGNVDKWLEAEEFVIRFPETQLYVKKLEVVIERYQRLYYR